MQKTIIQRLNKRIKTTTLFVMAMFLSFSHANAQVKDVKAFEFLSKSDREANRKALEFKNGAVVSAHPEATAVGVQILKKGGNAVDATVAVKFALAVVYPSAGNIGGGGFLIYRSAKGELNSMDFRE